MLRVEECLFFIKMRHNSQTHFFLKHHITNGHTFASTTIVRTGISKSFQHSMNKSVLGLEHVEFYVSVNMYMHTISTL